LKAKFINKFMFLGVEVYNYLDLDTNDFVWLEGGRSGKEMRRIPEPVSRLQQTGRAIDVPSPIWGQIQNNYIRYLGPFPHEPNHKKSYHTHY